jgi:hypothetical protein
MTAVMFLLNNTFIQVLSPYCDFPTLCRF